VQKNHAFSGVLAFYLRKILLENILRQWPRRQTQRLARFFGSRYNRIALEQREQPMEEFVTVAKVGDIAVGTGVAYPVNGRMVAVFNEDGKFFAIDDFCPHMGASLAGGHVEKGVVACPWHAWRFCIHDGKWCDNPRLSVDAFPVRVMGDEIQVHVPPKTPSPSAGT
jgi:nitrite reductase (NADH) small subunit/3-phenylpropionate/trans-cinnamate dioxygenase ferredoxin subunit